MLTYVNVNVYLRLIAVPLFAVRSLCKHKVSKCGLLLSVVIMTTILLSAPFVVLPCRFVHFLLFVNSCSPSSSSNSLSPDCSFQPQNNNSCRKRFQFGSHAVTWSLNSRALTRTVYSTWLHSVLHDFLFFYFIVLSAHFGTGHIRKKQHMSMLSSHSSTHPGPNKTKQDKTQHNTTTTKNKLCLSVNCSSEPRRHTTHSILHMPGLVYSTPAHLLFHYPDHHSSQLVSFLFLVLSSLFFSLAFCFFSLFFPLLLLFLLLLLVLCSYVLFHISSWLTSSRVFFIHYIRLDHLSTLTHWTHSTTSRPWFHKPCCKQQPKLINYVPCTTPQRTTTLFSFSFDPQSINQPLYRLIFHFPLVFRY